MTTDEYAKLLASHDWYYHYSDDHSVWRKGQANIEKLRSLAKQSQEFADMLQTATRRHTG